MVGAEMRLTFCRRSDEALQPTLFFIVTLSGRSPMLATVSRFPFYIFLLRRRRGVRSSTAYALASKCYDSEPCW